jgi:hypothetical protein
MIEIKMKESGVYLQNNIFFFRGTEGHCTNEGPVTAKKVPNLLNLFNAFPVKQLKGQLCLAHLYIEFGIMNRNNRSRNRTHEKASECLCVLHNKCRHEYMSLFSG